MCDFAKKKLNASILVFEIFHVKSLLALQRNLLMDTVSTHFYKNLLVFVTSSRVA